MIPNLHDTLRKASVESLVQLKKDAESIYNSDAELLLFQHQCDTEIEKRMRRK